MIDKSKTYITREGEPVRIYCTDGGGHYPVHGAVYINGVWSLISWEENGDNSNHYSLVEVKPKHDVDIWINIYHNHEGGYFAASGACTKLLGVQGHRFACVRLTQEVTEGEGM